MKKKEETKRKAKKTNNKNVLSLEGVEGLKICVGQLVLHQYARLAWIIQREISGPRNKPTFKLRLIQLLISLNPNYDILHCLHYYCLETPSMIFHRNWTSSA